MKETHAYTIRHELQPVPFEIGYTKEGQPFNIYGHLGYDISWHADGMQWAEPNEDDLVERLLEVYNQRVEAVEKGKKAAKYVRRNFSNTVVAKKLIKFLDTLI